MSARFGLPVLGALLAASCLVSIEDVEPEGSGSGGSGGTTDAASDGSGGTSAGGNAGTGGTSAGAGGSAAGSGGTSGSAGAAGSAGSSGSGGSSGASCMLPLSDDFGNGALPPLWGASSDSEIQVAETGGVLRFTFSATPSAIAYAGVFSAKNDYDLTACSVLARVVETPNPATDGYIHFAVNAGGDNAFEFNIGGGTIDAQLWIANQGSDVSLQPFDPSKHSWMRLSESGGSFVWETSGDGKSWTLFASTAAKFSVTAVHIAIGAGMYKLEAISPGSAAFDDLNLPPP